MLTFVSICVCPWGWLWCIYCSEPVWDNSSILAWVSGGRQQHSTFPALCVAWFGIGFPQPPGAQSTGMSLFLLPDYDRIRHTLLTHIHTNHCMHIHTLSTYTHLAHSLQEEQHTNLYVPWTWVALLCYVIGDIKTKWNETSRLCLHSHWDRSSIALCLSEWLASVFNCKSHFLTNFIFIQYLMAASAQDTEWCPLIRRSAAKSLTSCSPAAVDAQARAIRPMLNYTGRWDLFWWASVASLTDCSQRGAKFCDR